MTDRPTDQIDYILDALKNFSHLIFKSKEIHVSAEQSDDHFYYREASLEVNANFKNVANFVEHFSIVIK